MLAPELAHLDRVYRVRRRMRSRAQYGRGRRKCVKIRFRPLGFSDDSLGGLSFLSSYGVTFGGGTV